MWSNTRRRVSELETCIRISYAPSMMFPQFFPRERARIRAQIDQAVSLGLTNPVTLIKSIRNFAGTVWDPAQSDIGQGIDTLILSDIRSMSDEDVRRYEELLPEMKELFDEGYDPEMDPEELMALPPGTLGREYAEFVTANKLDPLGTLMSFGTPKNSFHYGVRRAYKFHDLLHVVLGCDTSVLGEVRIVSYSLGQGRRFDGNSTLTTRKGNSAAGYALAVLMLHLALRRPASELREAVQLSSKWMARGERGRMYSLYRFEDMLEQPLDEVRTLVLQGETELH